MTGGHSWLGRMAFTIFNSRRGQAAARGAIRRPAFAGAVWAGGLFAAAGSLAGCVAGRPTAAGPKIRDAIPSVESLDLKGVSLMFDVGVDNPLPIPIAKPLFQYTITVKGKPAASGEKAIESDLPASGPGRFKVPARIEFARLGAPGSAGAAAGNLDYELKGKLTSPAAPELAAPASVKGSAPVMRAPVIKLINLAPAEFSAKKVVLQADIEITNPNAFAIGARGLTYNLIVAGEQMGRLRGAARSAEIPPGATGRVKISGEVTAVGAVRNLFNRSGPMTSIASLEPVGEIGTPYGKVVLEDDPDDLIH